MLTEQKEKELVIAAQNGNQKAVRALIDAHRPLIQKTVRKLGYNLDPEDAFMEGVTGLLRALPRFETESGFRFNTYARHYISEAIREASSRAPLIRIARTRDGMQELKAARQVLAEEGKLTPAILSQKSGMSFERANEAILKLSHTRKTAYTSIDEAFEVADFRLDPEENLELTQRREILKKAKEVLTERELHIFEKRTAANDEPLTLEDLANVYGVSRERIRQIELKALDKVKKRLYAMGVIRRAA